MMQPGISKAGEHPEWSPPTKLYSITTVGRHVMHDGESLRCYTLTEGKQVLIPMFADYRALFEASWVWEAQRAELESTILTLKAKIALNEGAISFYQDEADHWRKIAGDRDLKLERSKRWSWVPWGIVVVQSIAVSIVGISSIYQ